MSIAVQGTTPDTFEIKSATLPLIALVLKSADLGALDSDAHAGQLSGRSDTASPGDIKAGGGKMKPRDWLFFATLRLRTNAQRFF